MPLFGDSKTVAPTHSQDIPNWCFVTEWSFEYECIEAALVMAQAISSLLPDSLDWPLPGGFSRIRYLVI